MQGQSSSKNLMYMSPKANKVICQHVQTSIQKVETPLVKKYLNILGDENSSRSPQILFQNSQEKKQAIDYSPMKKKIKEQKLEQNNPYLCFEDEIPDQLQMIKVKNEQRDGHYGLNQFPKEQINVNEANTIEMLASPRKRSFPKYSKFESQQEIKEQSSQDEPQLQQNYPRPFFFKAQPRNVQFSKLLCFVPNQKNGKVIRYDNTLRTCIPIYICDGCEKEYKVASALGGHMSKCEKRYDLTLNNLPSIAQMGDFLNDNSQEISNYQQPQKTKTSKISVKKVRYLRKRCFTNYSTIRKSNSLVGKKKKFNLMKTKRTRAENSSILGRQAKHKANLLIKLNALQQIEEIDEI